MVKSLFYPGDLVWFDDTSEEMRVRWIAYSYDSVLKYWLESKTAELHKIPSSSTASTTDEKKIKLITPVTELYPDFQPRIHLGDICRRVGRGGNCDTTFGVKEPRPNVFKVKELAIYVMDKYPIIMATIAYFKPEFKFFAASINVEKLELLPSYAMTEQLKTT